MRQFEHDSFQAVCNQTTYGQYSSSVDSIKRNSTFSSEEDVEGSLYNGKEMRNGKIKAIWLIDNRGGANQVLMYLTDLATILGFKVLEAHDFGGKNDTVARNVNSINKSEVDILIATPGRLFSILDVLFKQRAIDRSILRNNTDEAHPTILKCWEHMQSLQSRTESANDDKDVVWIGTITRAKVNNNVEVPGHRRQHHICTTTMVKPDDPKEAP